MLTAFLSNWWKKLKTQLKEIEVSETAQLEQTVHLLDPDPLHTQALNQQMQSVLEALQKSDINNSHQNTTASHLQALDPLLDPAAEQTLDQKASVIREYLDLPEAYQILRQTRWPHGVQCTGCQSYNLRRLPQRATDSEHNHRYRCLDCHLEFNDDEGVTGNGSTDQSLTTWMQCWYLMGCTDSLHYIAHFLGLDLHVVEWMVQRLKTLFNLNAPIKRLQEEADDKEHDALSIQAKANFLSSYQQAFHAADATTVPLDTSEFRRQQTLRRQGTADTQATIDPTPGTPQRKR
jgi:transposase-like protein